MKYDLYRSNLLAWSSTYRGATEDYKFHRVIRSLKTNNEVKDLKEYVGTMVIQLLISQNDQTVLKIVEALDLKYKKTKTERYEDLTRRILGFKLSPGVSGESAQENLLDLRFQIKQEDLANNLDVFILTVFIEGTKKAGIVNSNDESTFREILEKYGCV